LGVSSISIVTQYNNLRYTQILVIFNLSLRAHTHRKQRDVFKSHTTEYTQLTLQAQIISMSAYSKEQLRKSMMKDVQQTIRCHLTTIRSTTTTKTQ
jgi:hypothetical protein